MPLTLKSLFAKPVDRPIEGVIKADDEESLRLEVEEYVLTNEVAKRLSQFLEAYNHYENANGVWISGFFGSGKSHLLKMLSMLLQNQVIDGTPMLERFLPKCEDELLKAEITKAVGIPSQSILFNIDQKADVISKEQMDALLAVFMKVFDEMCGYFGKLGHIAQFERDLDSRDLFGNFRTAYEMTAGKPWEQGREQAILEKANIATAYAEVTQTDPGDAKGILDRYRKDYRVSIEEFAEKVDRYLKTKPDHFRLNFFVDEVGQYIAENTKLMTNLQTIAESLATKCRGRAWVIVTAQSDMQKALGSLTNKQANDFSKIQARFANRLNLTSADVDEVIERRLLEKKPEHHPILADLYHANVNNFGVFFDFGDGARTYRNYRDQDHFVNAYPFVPYQFTLFQDAISGLSSHSAFEGKHSSVGERSMLAVFQDVAVHIKDHEPGQLATFDLMYEGISSVLKGRIKRSIQVAEDNLGHPFATRLLKALFLVKYVREFKASKRNLCVLMHESFDTDLQALKAKVDKALILLENQSYVQRNGEVYNYLSDEERDIEEEIKNEEVESTDVAKELEGMIFTSVLKDSKIRHEQTRQDYPFSRKLDERLYGRERELALHVITPFHDDHPERLETLMLRQAGRDELLAVLPADKRLFDSMMRYKRTEKYLRLNTTRTQQEGVRRILNDKQLQNQDRKADILELIGELFGQASFSIDGAKLDISGEDPRLRVHRAFQELITRTYPNLRMLRGVEYREADVAQCLNPESGFLGADLDVVSEAEQEILANIRLQQAKNKRTTAKAIVEAFQKKPYGWSYPAILCNIAKLLGRGKMQARFDADLINAGDLANALRNTASQGNIHLEPQIVVPPSKVRALKDFHQEFFNRPPAHQEATPLANETKEALGLLTTELGEIAAQSERYPFVTALADVLKTLKKTATKPPDWFFDELPDHKNDLLDLKENTIEPLRQFMSGPRRAIYDAAAQLVREQSANFDYIEGGDKDELKAILADGDCFTGTHMQRAKELTDSLKAQVDERLSAERDRVLAALDLQQQRFQSLEEVTSVPEEQKAVLLKPFEDLRAHLASQTLIPVVNDAFRKFQGDTYSKLLTDLAQANAKAAGTGGDTVAPVGMKYIPMRSLPVAYPKAWLQDEADVDAYLKLLRESLLEQIANGNRVQP